MLHGQGDRTCMSQSKHVGVKHMMAREAEAGAALQGLKQGAGRHAAGETVTD